jgi:hypothetical protein
MMVRVKNFKNYKSMLDIRKSNRIYDSRTCPPAGRQGFLIIDFRHPTIIE